MFAAKNKSLMDTFAKKLNWHYETLPPRTKKALDFLSKKDWLKMGYNDSVIHTDIFTTEDRTVTATLENGKEVVIYRKGRFTI